MITTEQKSKVIENINNRSVNEVAQMTGLKSSQVRWVMHANGITKGSSAGRPGTNKRCKSVGGSDDIFNVNKRSCWISGLD